MAKSILVVIAVICYVTASPDANGNNNFPFGSNFPFTNFPQIKFPPMPEIKFPPMPEIKFPTIPTIKPLTAEDIEKMGGVPGGSSSGMLESFSSKTEIVDGKPVTKTEGFIIVNKDGKVTKTKFSN